MVTYSVEQDEDSNEIYLLILYDKSEIDNISKNDLLTIKESI